MVPKVGTFKVQYMLCSENISLFYSINLGVCLFVCLIQKILGLVKEKVEKNCMFFSTCGPESREGEESAHIRCHGHEL